MEASIIDIDGPPSSPFVTEVESRSREASKQWPRVSDDTDANHVLIEAGRSQDVLYEVYDDKENMVQDEPTATLKRIFASPQKPSTPELKTPEAKHACDSDAVLMPAPTTATMSHRTTPKRSPLKPVQSVSNTPAPLSRGNSYENASGLDTSQDGPSMDDTCFSTFSEIPDMTVFAKLGHSPTKRGDMLVTPGRSGAITPKTSRKRSSPSRSPSPTPRKQKTPGTINRDGTTSFLIDFTQQIESVGSFRSNSPVKSSTESNLLQYINNQRSPNKPRPSTYATPSKPSSNILNLLDFELPPAPTPRSIPTITVRELESLKSSYLSQISSLKATLSGREAEVESLKRAINDAERRAGEAQESLREEKCRREQIEEEKLGWEKRGQEVENVLKSVKEEVLKSEAEKEDWIRKVEESERRAEEAEAKAIKAEERLAFALATRAANCAGEASDGAAAAAAVEEQVQRLLSTQLDAKIEAVSRELHAVYKEKHERKVATLKKSYEARAEKKLAELQRRVSELESQNEELLAAKDATLSGPVVGGVAVSSSLEAELKAQLEAQKAAIARMESEMLTSKQQRDALLEELQNERTEKGELVAAVDEMLALQKAETSSESEVQGARSVVEDFRKSIGRPHALPQSSTSSSGLRAPGVGGSRIGGVGRSASGGAGAGAVAGKSRLLSNIERMGRSGHATAGGSGSVE